MTQMNDLTQLPTVESKAGNDSNHLTHRSQIHEGAIKNVTGLVTLQMATLFEHAQTLVFKPICGVP